MNRVVGFGKLVLEMEVDVTVVAGTDDKHDTEVGETLHFVGQHSSTVHIVHIVKSPAAADDQSLAFLLGYLVHPVPGIYNSLDRVKIEGGKQEFGVVGNATIVGPCAGAGGDGGAVRAVIMIVVTVGCVTQGS